MRVVQVPRVCDAAEREEDWSARVAGHCDSHAGVFVVLQVSAQWVVVWRVTCDA